VNALNVRFFTLTKTHAGVNDNPPAFYPVRKITIYGKIRPLAQVTP